MEWCVAYISLLANWREEGKEILKNCCCAVTKEARSRRPVARQHPHLWCKRTFDAATWQVVVKKAKRKQVDFFLSFRTCFKITETKR
jgi:hypothetical protein